MPKDEDLSLDELEAAIAQEQAAIEAELIDLIEAKYPVKVAEFIGEFEEGEEAGAIAGAVRVDSSDFDWPAGDYDFVSTDAGLTLSPKT